MSDALAAALLGNQRRTSDPGDRSRRYAELLMQQGASMAPARGGAVEGIARALTGGLGGLAAYYGDKREEDKRRATSAGLLEYANASTDEQRAAAQAKLGDADPSIVAALAAQLIGQKQKQAVLDKQFSGMPTIGGAPGPMPGAAGPIDPNAALSTTSLPPGQFANNTGNIRAAPGVSFPGQGAAQNGFMTFDTPQSGVNAQASNFGAYVKQNPGITVAQALSKWAPPNENNTPQYISTIAENSGVNPGMPMGELMKDPGAFAALMDAQTRMEKGGAPQGVTADTFMSAAGAQPQPGFQPTNVPAQNIPGVLPQTTAPVQGPVVTTPELSPQAMELQRMAQASTNKEEAIALQKKALETHAAYVQDRAKTAEARAYDQQEHNRREATTEANKPLSEFQAKSSGFADRMINSAKMLDSVENPVTFGAKAKAALPGGIGNALQTPQFQQYDRAKRDWINAQLRLESGAVIGDAEFANAEKQYFPQPGDSPAALTDKKEARRIATEAMARGAGAKYKMPVSAAPGGIQPGHMEDGYRFKGGNPADQSSWEKAQ